MQLTAQPRVHFARINSNQTFKTHLTLARSAATARPRIQPKVVSWGFFKKLGFQKPAFLPDFGLKKRQALLQRFYGPIDRKTYEELLSPSFVMHEEWNKDRQYSREEMIDLMCNRIAPAIPDFKWTAATDGEVDKDGFAIAEVQVSGHFNGDHLDMGKNLPPVPPSGERIRLPVAFMKVKVEDGKIEEIISIGAEHTGPFALYEAVGGKLSESSA